MFGCIVAGRPVNTDFQTLSPTQFAFRIPAQPTFSHLVVFLLPGQSLAAGQVGGVYIQLPPSQDFKLLGAIANEKQSAIFKVNTASSANVASSAQTTEDDAMVDDAPALPANGAQANLSGPDIVVGISIEPAESIGAQLEALKSQKPADTTGTALVRHQPQGQPLAAKVLAQRIIKNAFNFLSSFAGGTSGNETVPLKSFQDWWTKFEKRVEIDPSFLEREDQA